MKAVRPYRDHEVFASPCLGCGEEIESRTLPIPELCPSCQRKREAE